MHQNLNATREKGKAILRCSASSVMLNIGTSGEKMSHNTELSTP